MRLAIIVSHPIQYYSPWFRHLAAAMGCTPRHEAIGMRQEVEGNRHEAGGMRQEAEGQRSKIGGQDTLHDARNSRQNALRVFYLWDFGVKEQIDKGFGKAVKWDVDLLAGYDHEFVPNVSRRPGTDWFGGLDNPELLQRVKAFRPDAVLQFGYNYKSLVNFDLRWNTKRVPLLFRGDSHLLAEGKQGMRHAAMGMRREARGVRGETRGERLKRWVREIGLRLLFRRFACFLAVGKANADYFRAHGVSENKIVRCPHVVNNAFFIGEKNAGTRHEASGARQEGRGLREELGIAEDELVFLFAGKLEEKKQPMQLLEAFLAADLPGATLVFVGSGELEGALKERAFKSGQSSVVSSQIKQAEDSKLQTANSRGNVVFLEFQNQSRMPHVYRTGDVLVLPSKGRYETWGLAVNEAACCGLPAIVSSHVGCWPDLIESGVTGWVFEAGDQASLGKALEDAIANQGRLRVAGEELCRRVLSSYSYEAATGALLEVLSLTKKRVIFPVRA